MRPHPRSARPRPAGRLRRFAQCAAGLALTVTALSGVAVPAHADHDRLPAGRTLVSYVVERGDTVSALAVRFHAWTAEIVAHNHLGRSGALQVGQRIEIPVVRKDGATIASVSFAYDEEGRAAGIYIMRNTDKLSALGGAAIV